MQHQCPQIHTSSQTNPNSPSPWAGTGAEAADPQEYSQAAWFLPSAHPSSQHKLPVRSEGLCWGCGDAQEPLTSSPARRAGVQPGEPQLHVIPVRQGPAPATTAFVFNSQQLHSHAARQTHFRSPQLNVDNYGCLHQGTALPRLRRKNHILIPLAL